MYMNLNLKKYSFTLYLLIHLYSDVYFLRQGGYVFCSHCMHMCHSVCKHDWLKSFD